MKTENSYIIASCTAHHVQEIYQLQNEIIQGLSRKDLLRRNTIEAFYSCIKAPNVTLGVFSGNKLIGVGILVRAEGSEEDLSLNLKCHQVQVPANLKLIMIKEEFRGRGLQRKLMTELETIARAQGITHLCTTVSGDNVYSLNNIRAFGFEFDHDAIKYGGLARKVFVKDISIPVF